MVTEPLEALIAIMLISIILASIFIYNQRGTENIMQMRTLSRSIAGTVAGMYAKYINSGIYIDSDIGFYTFKDFNDTVNNFLEYIERKENVSIAANITVILKNGTLRTARLKQMSRPVKRSITENITVSLANESRYLKVYALPNRSYVYCNSPLSPKKGCNSWRSIGIYVVGYYSDGTPATSGSAQAKADKCFSKSASKEIQNGIALLELTPKGSNCSGTVTITVYYNIGGESGNRSLTLRVLEGSEKDFSLECNNKPCYFYFLGEQINLTPHDSTLNWLVKSVRDSYTGSGDKIITGSGSCGDLPCYIFFTPGPYNLSMNFLEQYNIWDTNQPFFIEPYFTIITVRVGFNR
ncbi:MAG: hypothetical protein NDF52_01710 [archaeon YNP-WB-062]|jgi:hypothetical protein|nr:hypothetical protein [Candidatus Culexarchaeum yellowstonense]